MKDILKCVGLLVVGLFVAMVVYPFLHETGHSIVAVLVGAKVIDLNLFPLPYVACEISELNKICIISIGLAGMFFPMVISIIIRPKSFWLWYGSFVMKGICLLSFTISFIAILFYHFGVAMKNEDIIQVVNIWNEGVYILNISMFLCMTIVIRSIIKQKPLNRIMDYFKVTMKKASAA